MPTKLLIGLEHVSSASRRRQNLINVDICKAIANAATASAWRDELLAPHAGGKAAPATITLSSRTVHLLARRRLAFALRFAAAAARPP